MTAKLSGRVTIITGASRGVGRATALAFAAEGADLLLAARNQSELDAVASVCRAQGARAEVVACDVTDPDNVAAMVTGCLRHFDLIDFLVNNSGVARYAPFLELTVQDWDQMMNVNLKGPFLCMQAVLPTMLRQNSGHIINISSIRGLETIPTASIYCATKFGLNGLSSALAKEVAKHGICITAICPGGIRTHLGGTTPEDKPEDLLAPDDVARAALFALEASATGVLTQLTVVPRRSLV